MTTETQNTKAGKVAILVADGFEQVELEEPRKALEKAGFIPEIVSPVSGKVQGFKHTDKGDAFPVDVKLDKADPAQYVGLVLPGGVHNPDTLRRDPKALAFVRHFFAQGKPVAAICHGPWTLIDAGVVAGRKLTSWPSVQTDLRNAGADWVDEEVVVDQGLVSSRKPDDLPAFCKKMIEELREGPHGGSMRSSNIAKVGEMIKDIKVAMLTTVESDGTPRSRPMATLNKKFDGTLWFFTSVSAEKVNEVKEHRQVNLNYADPEKNRYVTVSGLAKVVADRQKAEELFTPVVKIWFPKGLADPDLGLLRVDAEKAEFWDGMSHGESQVAHITKSTRKSADKPSEKGG